MPAAEMGRDLASRYWKYRATFPGDEWALPLVVRSGGHIIGVQRAEAAGFPILRTADTFSWLTSSAQGCGVGTLMRHMICTLFFDELEARAITSGAYADNPASAAVSKKVGFVPNGTNLELRDDTAAEHNKFILSRDRFVRPPEPVTIKGGAALRVFAGVARAEDPKS